MKKYYIEWDGVTDVVFTLRQKSHETFTEVVKEITTELRNTARKGTPVDTGELRKSLRQENPTSQRGGIVGYTKAYAPHVEYGHRTVNGGYVQGQYYFKKAVETVRPKLQKRLLEELKK